MAKGHRVEGNYIGTAGTYLTGGSFSLSSAQLLKSSNLWGGAISSGLVLHLDATNTASYPGTGTAWYDISGSNNNATLTNGPTFTSPYIQMDGSDDYAATSSSSSFAFGTGDFTLEAWVYPQSLGGYFHIMAFPTQDTLALKAEATSGTIYLYSPSWTTYGNGTISGWTLSLNTWNHVVFTRASGVGYAYLNGVAKGSYGSFNTSFSAQTLQVHKGHPSEFVQGRFSAARVYNRALSSTEVTYNYNATRSKVGV
jgi:hypothetical protein